MSGVYVSLCIASSFPSHPSTSVSPDPSYMLALSHWLKFSNSSFPLCHIKTQTHSFPSVVSPWFSVVLQFCSAFYHSVMELASTTCHSVSSASTLFLSYEQSLLQAYQVDSYTLYSPLILYILSPVKFYSYF